MLPYNFHGPLRLNKCDNIDACCVGEWRKKSSKTTRKPEKFSPPLLWPTSHLPPGKNILWCKNQKNELPQKTSPDNALASADLIVEAITENLPLKQKLFAEWDKVTGYECGSH